MVSNLAAEEAESLAVREFVSLFHGTSSEFAAAIRNEGIDLARLRLNTDFGRGFYLSESREVAENAARRLYGDAIEVLEYRIPADELEQLSHLHFGSADAAWEDFVRFHRTFEPSPTGLAHGGELYDMVSGPMFRRFGSDGAVRAWDATMTQVSIHTDRAIQLFNRWLLP